MELSSQPPPPARGNTHLEDSLTETVADLFKNSPQILFAWIKSLNLLNTTRYTTASVLIQQPFSRLEHHRIDSRPDVVIKLSDGNSTDLIFIESKVGSWEGYEQLKRYAEILDAEQGIQNKVLLYITRYYEPKDKETILRDIPRTTVVFRQERWHMFYHFLKSQPGDSQIDEVIQFMEKNGMAQNNRFTSDDIRAMTSLIQVLGLMNETLEGEVKAKFNQVVGSSALPYKELQWGRYTLHKWFNDKVFCGLGYRFSGTRVTDYPTVLLMLAVSPRSARRQEIIQAMHEICKRTGWRGERLDSNDWAEVVYECSLQPLLAEKDHVLAVKSWFRNVLEDLAAIKREYPNLLLENTTPEASTNEE